MKSLLWLMGMLLPASGLGAAELPAGGREMLPTADVMVTDAAGQPVPSAEVRVRQLRSGFGFGTAVAADWLTKEGKEGDTYRRTVEQCFSRVVFENDLKMELWEQSLTNTPDSTFRWDRTLKAMEWLRERDLPVRGHYLCWAPWEPWSEKWKNSPDQIKARILAHIPRITAEVGSRVMEWDAINHLAGWDKNIDEATGLDFYSEIMKTPSTNDGPPGPEGRRPGAGNTPSAPTMAPMRLLLPRRGKPRPSGRRWPKAVVRWWCPCRPEVRPPPCPRPAAFSGTRTGTNTPRRCRSRHRPH